MSSLPLPSLGHLLERYAADPAIAPLHQRYTTQVGEDSSEVLRLFRDAVPGIENCLWAEGAGEEPLALYQQLFREQEALITGDEARHHFTIVIPIADRPLHLESCLESLLQLCHKYGYGGHDGQRYRRVSAMIADDSAQAENQQRHRELARHFTKRGIETYHFGLAEQLAAIETLEAAGRERLEGVIGHFSGSLPGHKGASLMRNIAYLGLNRLDQTCVKRLFYFIDSDQEFRVPLPDGRRDYAINYLYHLDRIFSETGTTILTGKVVGDPPVSPAVMAGNFVEDVSAFLSAIEAETPQAPCRFHGQGGGGDDAAYHDMADLFGFDNSARSFDYTCNLTAPHDHAACLADFAARLNHFFDGEHPTRSTAYQHEEVFTGVRPARTIYTGNYIFRAEALRYFIPFAGLRLRMAGPVLGRIIRAELGERFVSANLPMLHKRTVENIGQSEFRPGIERGPERIDLSGEFERQFYGDVMLFTMERLTAQGYPAATLPASEVLTHLTETEETMRHRYQEKRLLIKERLEQLKTIFGDDSAWWQRREGMDNIRAELERFIANIEHNFGAKARGYAMILSEEHRQKRLAELQAALLGYGADRAAWETALSRLHRSTFFREVTA